MTVPTRLSPSAAVERSGEPSAAQKKSSSEYVSSQFGQTLAMPLARQEPLESSRTFVSARLRCDARIVDGDLSRKSLYRASACERFFLSFASSARAKRIRSRH